MHAIALVLVSMALPFALACGSSPSDFGRSCTEIGCLSFLRVELAFASALTRDLVQVLVEHDGQSFMCDFGAESDPCHHGFAPGFDPVTPNDEDRAVILLSATPQALRVTVVAATGSETQIIEPVYERSQPNGPDCPPTCSSANVTARFTL